MKPAIHGNDRPQSMITKKLFDLSALAVTGFTVVQAMLVFLNLYNRALVDQIAWHYSSSLTWYTIFIVVPLAFGLLAAFSLRRKIFTTAIRVLLYAILALQTAFQITATTLSENYWGYPFKRQVIFPEVSHAYKLISFSSVATNPAKKPRALEPFFNTNKFEHGLNGRKDPYYGSIDRLLMAFEDNSPFQGELYDFQKVYDDTTTKISLGKLNTVANAIYNCGIIDSGEMSSDFGKILNGIIVEYQTRDNERYLFAGLAGLEISNDHHPFYEFLFSENNGLVLLKNQRYYYDSAGFEGAEYTSLSPIFAMLLTVLSVVATILILLVRYFRSLYFQHP